MMTTEQIERYRAETPACRQLAHFNNAGAALVPISVSRAIDEQLQLEARIGGYEAMQQVAAATERFYELGARLLQAEPHQIAYTTSATDAYNRALTAIPFEVGDVILTTNHDYVSNQIAFLQLKKRFGVQVYRVEDQPEGGVDVAAMTARIEQYRPKLVAVTHIPTNSGLIQPIVEIGRVCKAYACLYLVDACQSMGQLPLDVRQIHCDFLTGTFRKFLRGPRGAGILYAAESILEQGLEPMFIDLRGSDWVEADRYALQPNARRFEVWERSYALQLGATAALEYALGVGMPAAARRIQALSARLRDGLSELPGARVLDRGTKLGGIVTVHFDGKDPKAVLQLLNEHQVNAAITTVHQARIDFEARQIPWAIRLSPHYYNTEAEIDRTLAILECC